ncbi:hypothetical protein [Mesorhizobium sp. M0698]|uniref:hypothetical protein n=1 Tax=Mesorhizobium sp. M0698 TaxID=2956987 RepID=UPI00333ABB8B
MDEFALPFSDLGEAKWCQLMAIARANKVTRGIWVVMVGLSGMRVNIHVLEKL